MEKAEIKHSHITKTVFGGEWMVTVDARDGELTHTSNLKFWKWDVDAKTYILESHVPSPHTESITSLSICKSPLMIATTSSDCTFKIWKFDTQWSCTATCSYKKEPAMTSSFSCDGSVLAVSFGSAVTLWSITGELHHVLHSQNQSNMVQSIAFIPNTRFFVTMSESHIDVWDLLTAQHHWCLDAPSSCLAVTKKKFAVFFRSGGIHTFDPSTPVPLKSSRITSVLSMVFSNNRLIVLDSEFVLRAIGEGPKTLLKPQTQIEAIGLSNLYASRPVPAEIEVQSKGLGTQLFEFIGVPSHIVAPPSRMASAFMRSLMSKRQSIVETKVHEDIIAEKQDLEDIRDEDTDMKMLRIGMAKIRWGTIFSEDVLQKAPVVDQVSAKKQQIFKDIKENRGNKKRNKA